VLSLLQAAANTKSASVANIAEKGELTSLHQDVCVESEVHLDFSTVHDREPLSMPLVLDLKAAELLVSPDAAPTPVVVLAVRAVIWLVSVLFFFAGAMRWFPGEAIASNAAVMHVSRAMESPVAVPFSERSDLFQAALVGDDSRCESLLNMEDLFLGTGPPKELTVADAWGMTALHAAAEGGSVVVAELFLEFGVHVDPLDARGETPLHLAAREGHDEVCELLLKRGASLSSVNAEDLTPLAVAGYADQEAVCRKLLALGASVRELQEEELPDILARLCE